MAEEHVEVRFLHHYTDRRDRKNPVAHKPRDRAAFPAAVARGLVTSRVAEFATKKAAAAADPTA